jgi:hypothetical protein
MTTMSEGGAPENDTGASEGNLFPELEIAGQSLHLDDDSEASVRAAHLPSEATVRTIGLLQILIGLTYLLSIGLGLRHPPMGKAIEEQVAAAGAGLATLRTLVFFAGFLGLLLYVTLGLALRDLRDWARWAVIVLTGLNLLNWIWSRVVLGSDQFGQAFRPSLASLVSLIGLAISAYIIFRLLTRESAFVCSKHYRFAVSETLRIRPAMGLRDWILLGVFLLTGVLRVIEEL